MAKMQMTFHESYGSLPKSTLALIKRHNVSPADFDYMLDQFYAPFVVDGWAMVNDHIKANSASGMYVPRFF